MKKPSPKPLPDLKAATRDMLLRVAGWMDTKSAEMTLYVTASSKATKAEWAVLEEARVLAVAYIRMGAKQ